MKKLLAAFAAAGALLANPAMADTATLNLTGTKASICDVDLANVTSLTVNVAEGARVEQGNLRFLCNDPRGARLRVEAQNGDLVQVINGTTYRINYAFALDSTLDAFDISERDTAPDDANRIFTFTAPGFNPTLAEGATAVFSMNINRRTEATQPDVSGSPQFSAAQAPGGTYTETFVFTLEPAV